MRKDGACAAGLPNFFMAAKPLRLAADTNVLVDIEDGVEDVLDALDVIKRRLPNADWLVSPSVLDELASLCDCGETERLRGSARAAISTFARRFDSSRSLTFLSEKQLQTKSRISFDGGDCCRTKTSMTP